MTIFILFLTNKHIMIADKFFKLRYIKKKSTIKSYQFSFQQYTRFHNMSLEELIEEAEIDEKKHLPLKQRRIRNRLRDYQMFLNNKYTHNTIKSHMSRIKTFYRTFEIELPYLPQIRVIPTINTTFKEILTKDDIKLAFEHTTNHKLRALILFMLSSGTAINEATKITIQQFIEATKEYHNETRIEAIIQVLKKRDDIIPTFFIVREKKKRPYYTFCSSEAVHYILIYLEYRLYRKGIKSNELLFEYTNTGAIASLIRLNDSCNFPRKENGYRRFHSHGFRKFFATNMKNAGMDRYDIDFLSGRKADTITEAYIQVKPEVRLQRYKKFMNAVTIFDEVNYVEITSQEKQHYDELKKEVKTNRLENEEIRRMLYDLKKLL